MELALVVINLPWKKQKPQTKMTINWRMKDYCMQHSAFFWTTQHSKSEKVFRDLHHAIHFTQVDLSLDLSAFFT